MYLWLSSPQNKWKSRSKITTLNPIVYIMYIYAYRLSHKHVTEDTIEIVVLNVDERYFLMD